LLPEFSEPREHLRSFWGEEVSRADLGTRGETSSPRCLVIAQTFFRQKSPGPLES